MQTTNQVPSLKTIGLQDIASKLPSVLTEDCLKLLSSSDIEKLLKVLTFDVWTVYEVASHGLNSDTYLFLGVYSTEENANEVGGDAIRHRKRYFLLKYTLQHRHGTKLYRYINHHKSTDDPFPITNNYDDISRISSQLYPGSTTVQSRNEVLLDEYLQ